MNLIGEFRVGGDIAVALDAVAGSARVAGQRGIDQAADRLGTRGDLGLTAAPVVDALHPSWGDDHFKAG